MGAVLVTYQLPTPKRAEERRPSEVFSSRPLAEASDLNNLCRINPLMIYFTHSFPFLNGSHKTLCGS